MYSESRILRYGDTCPAHTQSESEKYLDKLCYNFTQTPKA
jgi:hypothetical protein